MLELDTENWLIRRRGDDEVHALKIKNKRLAKVKSKYQYIEIVETISFGKALLLDGVYQSSEYDELLKHEVLVHPVLCLKSNEPVDVLVIGGGEGCVVREVLRHKNVKSVTMLELDDMVPELCQKHLGWDKHALQDDRVRLLFGDASQILPRLDQKQVFDFIIVDSTQPAEGSLAGPLVTETFLHELKRRLKPEGFVVGYGINAAPVASTLRREIRSRVSRIIHGTTIEYVTPCPFYSASFAFQISSIEQHENLAERILDRFQLTELSGERSLDLESLKSYLSIPWGYRLNAKWK